MIVNLIIHFILLDLKGVPQRKRFSLFICLCEGLWNNFNEIVHLNVAYLVNLYNPLLKSYTIVLIYFIAKTHSKMYFFSKTGLNIDYISRRYIVYNYIYKNIKSLGISVLHYFGKRILLIM